MKRQWDAGKKSSSQKCSRVLVRPSSPAEPAAFCGPPRPAQAQQKMKEAQAVATSSLPVALVVMAEGPERNTIHSCQASVEAQRGQFCCGLGFCCSGDETSSAFALFTYAVVFLL